MLNLLHFADQALYHPEQNAEPCTGMEAFMRYGGAVMPLIKAHGGEQLWRGAQRSMLIGPDDKDWHLVVLVKYPSAQAFVDMVTSEEYQAIALSGGQTTFSRCGNGENVVCPRFRRLKSSDQKVVVVIQRLQRCV